uniref:Uncharacterized protein n=1 Tax=Triticum urartu TaxID=4572 RepID=A0A8R7QPS3_TRIUA
MNTSSKIDKLKNYSVECSDLELVRALATAAPEMARWRTKGGAQHQVSAASMEPKELRPPPCGPLSTHKACNGHTELQRYLRIYIVK